MGIVYIITALLLIISFILIKKTEKTLDVISFTGISIVVFLAYNSLACYVMTFVRIPITLLSLSITNILFETIMFGIIFYKKEIQKYKLDKFSLLCIGIILISVLIVSYLEFGFPFEIKYETGDPAVHYLTSVMFAEGDSLLTTVQDDVHGSFQGRKIGSYVNSGILMKCFSSVLEEIDYYNIFIGFGIFILFMTGYMMYTTLETFTKSKRWKSISINSKHNICYGIPTKQFTFWI